MTGGRGRGGGGYCPIAKKTERVGNLPVLSVLSPVFFRPVNCGQLKKVGIGRRRRRGRLLAFRKTCGRRRGKCSRSRKEVFLTYCRSSRTHGMSCFISRVGRATRGRRRGELIYLRGFPFFASPSFLPRRRARSRPEKSQSFLFKYWPEGVGVG